MKNSTKLHFALPLVSLLLAACGAETPAPSPMPTPSVTATAPTVAETPSATPPVDTTPPTPAKPPMAELQKKTILGVTAAFNAHDVKKASSFYTADCVFAAPGPEGMKTETGREALEKSHTRLFTDVPDVAYGIVRVLMKGDQAAMEWIANGTNTGGEKPTGKKAGFRAATIMWFDADGNIKQSHSYVDGATIAMQMGKLPGKPRAIPVMPSGDAPWVMATPADDALADKAKAMWPTSWPKHDKKAYDASITDDFMHEDLAMPNDFSGRKAALAEFDMYDKAVPDLKITVDNAWAAGGVVVMEFSFGGTQKGALGPIKATGKPFTVHGIDFDAMTGDKMSKATSYTNGIELFAQLGLLPKKKK